MYFLQPVASTTAAPATFPSIVSSGLSAPSITNGRLTLNISASTGFMSGLVDAQTGLELPLSQASGQTLVEAHIRLHVGCLLTPPPLYFLLQSWLSYVGFNGLTALNGSKQASGAYIFRPTHEPPLPLSASPAENTAITGPVVNESWATYAYVTQETRLWAGAGVVEVEWTVGPVNVSDFQSHEVITRYETGAILPIQLSF